jgi:hypothetical protein
LSSRSVYEAVARLDPKPVDYARVGEALRVRNERNLWIIGSKLAALRKDGYLRVVGEGPSRHGHRGAKLYRLADREPHIQAALEWRAARFLAKAERLEIAVRTAERLAAAAASGLRGFPEWRRERDARIVAERARGVGLEKIGGRFGLGRERVRQIIAAAIMGRRQRRRGPEKDPDMESQLDRFQYLIDTRCAALARLDRQIEERRAELARLEDQLTQIERQLARLEERLSLQLNRLPHGLRLFDPARVLDAACRAVGVTAERVRGSSRVADMVAARTVVVRALADLARLSLPRIGALIGRTRPSALYLLRRSRRPGMEWVAVRVAELYLSLGHDSARL